jgi:ribosomal protein S6
MANNKRTYEAILVLDTHGSEDSADAMTSKVSEIIAGMGGEVKKVENLGLRDLARPQSKDLASAAYVKIDFESGPDGPTTIKEKLRLDKNFDRILIEKA